MSHSLWRSVRLSGLAVWLLACGAANPDAPLRSPSQDYRPPPPDTLDGRPVRAEGGLPEDRLEEGAVVGTEPALAPGWKADEHGVHHDPKKRVGGAVDVKHETGGAAGH